MIGGADLAPDRDGALREHSGPFGDDTEVFALGGAHPCLGVGVVETQLDVFRAAVGAAWPAACGRVSWDVVSG